MQMEIIALLVGVPKPPAATGAKVQQPGRARLPWAGFIAEISGEMRWKSLKEEKKKIKASPDVAGV